jgi:hypothetical protein
MPITTFVTVSSPIESADILFTRKKEPHFVKEHCEILASQDRNGEMVFLVHSKKNHSLGVARIAPDNRFICDCDRKIFGETKASLTMAAYLLGFQPEAI